MFGGIYNVIQKSGGNHYYEKNHIKIIIRERYVINPIIK